MNVSPNEQKKSSTNFAKIERSDDLKVVKIPVAVSKIIQQERQKLNLTQKELSSVL